MSECKRAGRGDDGALSMVFFDPPWGGPEYKKLDKVSLTLSGVPMHEVLSRLARRSRFVALKVPVNFDTPALVADCEGSLSLALHEKFKKMHLLVFRSVFFDENQMHGPSP